MSREAKRKSHHHQRLKVVVVVRKPKPNFLYATKNDTVPFEVWIYVHAHILNKTLELFPCFFWTNKLGRWAFEYECFTTAGKGSRRLLSQKRIMRFKMGSFSNTNTI